MLLVYCKFRNFCEGFIFCEHSHMLSFVKIMSSRNGKITLLFTYTCKSCPSREFLTSQICFLTLFEVCIDPNLEFLRRAQNIL